MHPKKLAVAITGGLLLCAATGVGWAHDMADYRPVHQAHGPLPAAPGNAAGNGVTVIERTLGDGPAGTIVVSQGTTVRLILYAPAGAELHLHGYNLSGTAADGAPVVMTFRADHVGRFPIEAHGVKDALGRTNRALTYIEVPPE